MYITKELIDLKKYFEKNNIHGIALDIDETLSNTTECWVADFFEKYGNPENLTPRQFIDKYTYMENAPYYSSSEMKEKLFELFKTPSAYENLGIMENSNDVVNQINKTIPIVAYLTMRPKAVLESTKIWLDKHGFPPAVIITRPDDLPHGESYIWKASIIQYFYPNILGMVDDNYGVIDQLSSEYKGKIYLYNSSKTDIRNDISVISCQNWQCVIDKIHL